MQTKDRRLVFSLEVIVEPDGGGFHAYAPALKGVHTCGQTEEEALESAKDAIIAYLDSLIEHGDPIPVGVAASSNQGSRMLESSGNNADRRVKNLILAVA